MSKINADYVMRNSVELPETVFMLGANLDYVADWIRDVSKEKHLSIGNILDATPPRWLHLKKFAVGKKMVTNGEYLAFLNSVEQRGDKQVRLYDASSIWRYVWSDREFRVTKPRSAFDTVGGGTTMLDGYFAACDNFVDAYIHSLRHELSKKVKINSDRNVVSRVFTMVKYLLRNSIIGPEDDEFTLFSEEERAHIDYYGGSPKKLTADIKAVLSEAKKQYLTNIDKRFEQAFKRGKHTVETMQILERLTAVLRKMSDISRPVPLSHVLYPRSWSSPKGMPATGFKSERVDWMHLPVTGISFYEAFAFVSWLGKETGLKILLPDEAQFERAGSWRDEQDFSQPEIVVDPRAKSLFPWEARNKVVSNHYFGHEGKEVDKFYTFRKDKYQKLMKDTAIEHRVGSIWQLIGFGWQWTIDRYQMDERKYNRFDSEYGRYTAKKVRIADSGEYLKDAVFEYEPNGNVELHYFVLRGAPDIIGGPGLITRRYTAYPLRGYENVGFRWVVDTR